MASTNDAYLIRFPDGMRERLKSEAEASNRALNNYIIHLLDTHPDRKSSPRYSAQTVTKKQAPKAAPVKKVPALRPKKKKVHHTLKKVDQKVKGKSAKEKSLKLPL